MTTFLTRLFDNAGDYLKMLPALLVPRRDRGPIDSVAALTDFVASRAAYHAQKTLYGYVKARMGIRYPAMFEDASIIASLNIAKMNVLAACLSDLTLYAVAHATQNAAIANQDRAALALRIYRDGLATNTTEAASEFSAAEAFAGFSQRLESIDWRAALKPESFTESPKALLRWAPIADKLKKFDSEIVANSATFAWRDIREQFRKRLRADAVSADWRAQLAIGRDGSISDSDR
ncbi:MAG: hypothetical protein JSR61_15560 [Proteobacteria bacterium]|nr:hypothetical protein [Pseudomonadota bacterium]